MEDRRDDQILFFLLHTYDTIDHLQYVSDGDIDEFQGVIEQLPDDFSDDLRGILFHWFGGF